MQQIAFVCEQDGNIEKKLKKYWADHLRADVHVTLGCLARVRYGDSPDQKVALCLRADGADKRMLVDNVSSAFKRLFKTTESLDIIFLSEEQQQHLLKVARPFYEQAARSA